MKDISLNVLDIVQNSITAKADLIQISIDIDDVKDMLTVTIEDNGIGMDEGMVEAVKSPFTTTRTTRKVGLGIPMFMERAESSGGSFEIESVLGAGTKLKAVYGLSHIDRPPLGEIGETVYTLIICNPDIDFNFTYSIGGKVFSLDTKEVRAVLGDIPLNSLDVSEWIRATVNEGIAEINTVPV